LENINRSGSIDPDAPHTIIAALEFRLRIFAGTAQAEQMRAVIEHGRPYVGISRPKGYRKRKARACFWNAADLALNERGTYVEGYAQSPASGELLIIHHAWLTLDGVHAIDVTWDVPADCRYLGIPFPNEIVRRYSLDGRDRVPLLSSAALRELLRKSMNSGAAMIRAKPIERMQ
jgi:hypothetical protein